MKRILYIIAALLAFAAIARAQEFSIRKVEVAGTDVLVYYDLLDTVKARTYTINLYSSLDSFVTPLTKVGGDLGLEVKPGRNRKITWRAKEELGPDFDGKVGLEVRGKLYVPFIRFQGFKETMVRKRGVPFDVVWSGGRATSLINFELLRGDELVAVPHNNVAATVGKVTLRIPTNVKPGDNYRFRIVDSKNKDDVIYTDPFTVKRKIPLLVKALPVAIAGFIAYKVLTKEDPVTTPEIQDPITPLD